jgi:two-component system, chemotaxis family, chemotaxis protein CheY
MNLKREDLKILLVDDSDFSRQLIKTMLKEEGFIVSAEASSAESALSSIKQSQPHVLITDIVMPKVSGIELTEKVSKNYESISVIVISSLSQEHVVLEAIGAGARDFIAKPIQKQQIVDSLDKILQEMNG